MTLAGTHVVVVGLGASGLAAARLAAAGGASVTVTDHRPAEALPVDALPAGTTTAFGGHPISVLETADQLVLSPGVPTDLTLVREARKRAIAVRSEIEFAWRHRTDAPLAAVTGSNGKSTVTTLIAHMLRTAGIPAVAGGNLGPPASDLVLDPSWAAWVLEVSSFQSEILTDLRPRVGVFLNVSQDHLERHPGMEHYARAKARLFAFQQPGDTAVFNRDDARVARTRTDAAIRWFSLETGADASLDGERLLLGSDTLLSVDEMPLSGRHNVANALASALAARAMGAGIEPIRESLRTFTGLPHRHALVCEADGIRWIDDSKATNVGAAIAALSGYAPRSVHLILGGLSKGQDLSQLVEPVRRFAAAVYLIGRDAPAFSQALENHEVPILDCGTLERAVEQARQQAVRGETVLLAPACASFDQFIGYGERGDAFGRLATRGAQPCR